MHPVVTANIDALRHVTELIDKASGEKYRQQPPCGTSPIGRHIRHILDHFYALRNGLEKGVVDYDQRNRDCALETDAKLAKTHTESIMDWLSQNAKIDRKLIIKTEVSTVLQQPVSVTSSLKRELVYLMNHTLHHSAYIALLIRSLGEQVDENIGVAPATQNYISKHNLKQVG